MRAGGCPSGFPPQLSVQGACSRPAPPPGPPCHPGHSRQAALHPTFPFVFRWRERPASDLRCSRPRTVGCARGTEAPAAVGLARGLSGGRSARIELGCRGSGMRPQSGQSSGVAAIGAQPLAPTWGTATHALDRRVHPFLSQWLRAKPGHVMAPRDPDMHVASSHSYPRYTSSLQ